jgi:hypothetical protein
MCVCSVIYFNSSHIMYHIPLPNYPTSFAQYFGIETRVGQLYSRKQFKHIVVGHNKWILDMRDISVNSIMLSKSYQWLQ